MRLRDANPDDIPILEHWDRQPHVIEAGGDDDWFDWHYEIPRKLDWRKQLIAEIDGRPIGVVQIIDPALEQTHYWGEIGTGFRAIDIWIGEARDLGRGYGTQMMQITLARFYERPGFTTVEQRRFGNDDCLVMRLERSDWAG